MGQSPTLLDSSLSLSDNFTSLLAVVMNASLLADYLYPPTPLVSERVQLCLLLIMFCIGAPINLAAFTRLLRHRSMGRNGRLNLLKLHLAVSDLMVIFIYVTTQVCWQITYEFRGGEMLCKLVKFLSSTSFQASSNLIVAVAMDRLFTVLNTNRWYKKRFKRKTVWYVRWCVILAWTSAVIINAPQLFVWRLYNPYPMTQPQWRQCSTVYAVNTHKRNLNALLRYLNPNGTIALLPHQDVLDWRPLISKFTYNLVNLLFVFWIPAALIIASYSCVLLFLYRIEAKRRRAMYAEYERTISQNNNNEMMDTVPLQQHDLAGTRNGSVDSSTRRRLSSNAANEIILSAMSIGDSRKESQSTNASLHVYLVPIEISRVRNNTFRVSFILVAAYLLFWTPYNALTLWQFLGDDSYRRYVGSVKFFYTLIVLNSVVNPFLYGAVKFRKRKYS